MTVIEEKIVSMNALPSSAALKPNDNKVMPFDEQTIDVNWLKDFPEKLQNPEKKTGKLLFWGVGGVCGALFMWLCYKGYLTISFPSFYSLTRVRF